MKRLVDAQLPIRLANHLRQMSVEALHTSELPLRNRTPDAEIKHLSIIPIVEPKFTKARMNENPIHKVLLPALFPSRSGGNLQEGGNCKLRPRCWYYPSKLANAGTIAPPSRVR